MKREARVTEAEARLAERTLLSQADLQCAPFLSAHPVWLCVASVQPSWSNRRESLHTANGTLQPLKH